MINNDVALLIFIFLSKIRIKHCKFTKILNDKQKFYNFVFVISTAAWRNGDLSEAKAFARGE